MCVADLVLGHRPFNRAYLKFDVLELCVGAGLAYLCHEVALHELQLLHPGAVLDIDDKRGSTPSSRARMCGQGGPDDIGPTAPWLVSAEVFGQAASPSSRDGVAKVLQVFSLISHRPREA